MTKTSTAERLTPTLAPTLKTLIGLQTDLKVFTLPRPKGAALFAANIVAILLGAVGDTVLVKRNDRKAIITKGKYEQLRKHNGLHVAGKPQPKVELVGAVIFATRCTEKTFCPQCKLCDSPMTG
mgnify:CR=1 FL=1